MNPNIAVVGCGRWGRNLVRNFAALGALRVMCDVTPTDQQPLAAQYPQVEYRTQLAEVLADPAIDGVVVATPAPTHYQVARAALEADKDVMVEKPLVLDVAEGEALVRLAQERDRLLMVGHLLYYHPALLRLHELVKQGVLGDLYYLYSHRLSLGQIRREENVLWSFAPHDISALLLLTGALPQWVSACGGSYLQPGIPDVAMVNLGFPQGIQAHIFVSWLNPCKEQRLVVVGSRGMATFDDRNPSLKLTTAPYEVRWEERLPVAVSGETQPVAVAAAEPLRQECQHFLECIATRQPPRSDGQNGLAALRVLQACQRSLEQRGAVVSLASEPSPPAAVSWA